MPHLTAGEWNVLEVLWQEDHLPLGEVVEALRPHTGWSRNTVHTYLTRMAEKGLVTIDRSCSPHRYRAAVSRNQCQAAERQDFLDRVYQGSAGNLVAAFLKEGKLSPQEREELRALLDAMEV